MGDQEHHCGKYQAQRRDMNLRLLDSFRPSRTVIIAQDGLCPAGNPAKRHGNHQHKALNNGHAGQQHISLLRSAVLLNHRIQRNDQDVVKCNDQKWA